MSLTKEQKDARKRFKKVNRANGDIIFCEGELQRMHENPSYIPRPYSRDGWEACMNRRLILNKQILNNP